MGGDYIRKAAGGAARAGTFTASMNFGGVGMAGVGAYAHNNVLHLSASFNGHRVLADPGSGLYTADIELRNMLHATSVHAVVQCDGREQRNILNNNKNDVFRLRGSVKPARVVFHDDTCISVETRAIPSGVCDIPHATRYGYVGCSHRVWFEVPFDKSLAVTWRIQ